MCYKLDRLKLMMESILKSVTAFLVFCVCLHVVGELGTLDGIISYYHMYQLYTYFEDISGVVKLNIVTGAM